MSCRSRVNLPSEPFPSWIDGNLHWIDRMLDTAPYVSHGAYVDACLTRISTAAAPECDRRRRLDSADVPGRTTLTPGCAMQPPSLTIGIEEEYQIIDPQTRELRSYITQILEDGKMTLREQMKPELHQSVVEVGTEICRTPAEARAELVRLRRSIMELAAKHGLKIAAAGTHPFSSWLKSK
jgi:hypothetical protein